MKTKSSTLSSGIVAFALILFSTSFAFAQWNKVETGITDDLNHIFMWDVSNGAISGNKGMYKTSSAPTGPSDWTRWTCSSPSVNAVYDRCRFIRSVGKKYTKKLYVCGHDTVNDSPVIFKFDLALNK